MSSPPKNRKKKSGAAPAPNCQLSVDTSTMGTIVTKSSAGRRRQSSRLAKNQPPQHQKRPHRVSFPSAAQFRIFWSRA